METANERAKVSPWDTFLSEFRTSDLVFRIRLYKRDLLNFFKIFFAVVDLCLSLVLKILGLVLFYQGQFASLPQILEFWVELELKMVRVFVDTSDILF